MAQYSDPSLPGENSMADQAVQERIKDGRYEFTEEEKRALRECRFESFWYRSFPLAAVAGVTTQTLVQRGILSPSKRFGSIPKVMFASVCGYVLGKMLYIQQCREKFLKLEHSPFAEMMRRGRGGMPPGAGFGRMQIPGYEQPSAEGEFEGGPALQQDTPWSGGHDQRLNMDIDTSQVKGVDNTFDADLQLREDEGAEKREMTTTYDELRKRARQRNAQQYTQVLPGHYQPKEKGPLSSPQPGMDQQATVRRPPPKDEFSLGARNRSRMTNQYGDTWEKE